LRCRGAEISENEVKVSIIVAVVLVLTALINFRVAAASATAYLIVYGVSSMRNRGGRKSDHERRIIPRNQY
jgi:hypothetical protein